MMLIVAKGGETFARLQFNVGPGGSVQVAVETDFSLPFHGADQPSWEKEYLEAVHEEPEFFPGDDFDDPDFLESDATGSLADRGFSHVLDAFEESEPNHIIAEDGQ